MPVEINADTPIIPERDRTPYGFTKTDITSLLADGGETSSKQAVPERDRTPYTGIKRKFLNDEKINQGSPKRMAGEKKPGSNIIEDGLMFGLNFLNNQNKSSGFSNKDKEVPKKEPKARFLMSRAGIVYDASNMGEEDMKDMEIKALREKIIKRISEKEKGK
jgi:hypothetical protein